MRVHWFHLMPYAELPADFAERYRSVWVDVPSELYDPVAGHRMYHEYLDELVEADRQGYDGICVNEHHQNAYGMMPSPNLMASILARETKHAAVVVMGNSLALYNPPIRVAEEMAMLDVLSNGRLIAGFPVGTSMDANYCYGQTPATLRDKWREAHDLILQAWTRPETFAFNGKYTQLRYVNVWPRPIQRPHPPIWVPGLGSLETWEWVARHDYVYSYLSYWGYKRGQRMMDGYWEALNQLGYDQNPYRAGFAQGVVVADSDAAAERDYAEHVQYFYEKCLHIYEGFADAPGYRSIRSIEATLAMPSLVRGSERRGTTWRELVDGGAVVAGSPSTVRDQLLELVRTLRVGHLMVMMHFGNMPREKVQRSSELFAREVLPALREVWTEWPDRWYPSVAGEAPS